MQNSAKNEEYGNRHKKEFPIPLKLYEFLALRSYFSPKCQESGRVPSGGLRNFFLRKFVYPYVKDIIFRSIYLVWFGI